MAQNKSVKRSRHDEYYGVPFQNGAKLTLGALHYVSRWYRNGIVIVAKR